MEMNRNGKQFVDPGEKVNKQFMQGKTTTQLIPDQIPAGFRLEDMEGACPGMEGEARLTYYPKGEEKKKIQTGWTPVSASKDFTAQWKLKNLRAGTDYEAVVEARPNAGAQPSDCVKGRFNTAPAADAVRDIRFVVVTCHEYPLRDAGANGHEIYDTMLKMKPDFFVHTGDVEYYDKPHPYAWTEELMRFKWNRLFALPYQRSFLANVTTYFMKDDHDTLKDDCWPGQTYGAVTFERGAEIFDKEQFPSNDKPYKTIRWGKDLQIWIVETRNYRSPNTMPDGPEKTIWGKEQKQWFFDSVARSDATFKVLISPNPLLGPDRKNKRDNHANDNFRFEGDELRAFINRHKMFITNGDRHWQYVTHRPGTDLWEFGCGPGSDVHAGGWPPDDKRPEHRFLRVKGGFLSVEVSRRAGAPSIRFRHHDVFGTVMHDEVFPAK